jgi:hypothetical protein
MIMNSALKNANVDGSLYMKLGPPRGIGSSIFHLIKWILFILNEISGFEVGASNGVYKVNVCMFFKI